MNIRDIRRRCARFPCAWQSPESRQIGCARLQENRRMYDESALRRWMSLEMRKINDGVVSARVPLSHLLEMERPVAVTRGGREHIFDRDVIRKIGEALPARLRSALRLPIVFYFDMDVADSCMCADEVALAVLQELGELSRERRMADGRAWVGRAIVFALVRKYPTAVQIMMR